MSKEQITAAIDDSWRDFKSALEPLTTEEMTVPGASGEWSVKDLMGHISSWETALTRSLLAGGVAAPPGSDPTADAFNDREVARKSTFSVARIVTELDAAHRALRLALDDAPDSLFESDTSMRERIDRETALHYYEHAAEIRSWAQTRQATS